MVGVAVGFGHELQLSVVAGLQLYEVAPLTVILVLVPKQIVVEGETVRVGVGLFIFIVGVGFTTTFTVAVPVQPPKVPVTVYVVVTVGDALGFGQLVQLKPADGVHLYEVAPLADKGTVPLWQIVSVGEPDTVIVGPAPVYSPK